MAWSTILVEILGGLAVILGVFFTVTSLPMAAVLLVAMFTVDLAYGFSSIKLEAVTAAGAQFGPSRTGSRRRISKAIRGRSGSRRPIFNATATGAAGGTTNTAV